MVKKVGAVLVGVLIGLVIAFARAGAFPFWSSNDQNEAAPHAKVSPRVVESQAASKPAPAPANQSESLPREGVVSSFAPLVKRVMPTVVNVSVVQEIKIQGFGFPFAPPPGEGDQGPGAQQGPQPGPPPGPNVPFDPFEQFRRFFGQQIPHEYKQHGLGSGVIISPDGYILTNNHVVGGAEEINVTLMDGREFKAKVVGRDPKTDLGLIKINTRDSLPYATLGNSDQTHIGDWVIAIGNPFGFNLTVTAGIVSAKGRVLGGSYDNFIQTDASINPGNSGGPLFNTTGQVIGINTAIYSRTGTFAGIGFAIPSNLAQHVMDQLKKYGHVIRGWLGVEIQEVTPDLAQSFGLSKPEGALVASITKGGPAEKAGILRGDVIIKYDDKTVNSEHQLPVMVADTPVGKEVKVEVIRNGKHETLTVKIGELKEQPVQMAKAEETGGNWGMQVGEITPEIASGFHLKVDKGVVIRRVAPDSPAADAGLQPGDIVLEVNKDKVNSLDDFLNEVKKAKSAGKGALLLVQRGDATLYTVVKAKS